MEKFFNPHNTPGYALLKTGIVGLITIAVVASTAGREYFNRKGPAAVLALALFFTLGAVFGYGVKNQIIIGVTLGFLTFESAS
jgi:O-antigen ligase